MTKRAIETIDDETAGLARADRDIVTLGMAIAAIILFVGTAGSVMPKIVRAWLGTGAAPDMLLTNAVLLNIALLIFGWRRYADLQREVSERRRAEAKAQELATVDPLTGCFNRRSGGPAIDLLLFEARAKRRNVAVLMVDLDNFKQINDVNGHKTGDTVLSEVARRISEQLPADGVLARIGGDEFVCALPCGSQDRDSVELFATQLIQAVSAPIDADQLRVQTTISIGIGSTGEDGSADSTDSETLIHRADIAMYHAKKYGRNRFCWFEPLMESELRRRNELETGIRRGIRAGEFLPFYEQQIDLETGDLVGFEMLARWHSPQFGLVGPDVFIQIADDIDQIGALSEALIRQALSDAREWDPRLSLSVNISARQIRDPWFPQKLLRMLSETGFPANRLEVEITESSLHDNVSAVRTFVASLKNQGIRLSLDDFGTGYSSFTQLRSLPFDRLKIDRSFVHELADEGMGHELVEAIMALGRGLSLPMTAEGVESEMVLERLRSMGNLKGQGYLYGKPEDAAATRERLAVLGLLNASPAEPAAAVEPALEGATHEQRKAG